MYVFQTSQEDQLDGKSEGTRPVGKYSRTGRANTGLHLQEVELHVVFSDRSGRLT